MPNLSEQKIMVVCDFKSEMNENIVHGVRMATFLEKELCLLHFLKRKDDKETFLNQLVRVTKVVKNQFPALQVSNLQLRGRLKTCIPRLAERYNALLVVVHKTDAKNSIKALRRSSIPILFVKGESAEFMGYKQVILPVDFRKASKETSLWASYLGRFNQAVVHVIYAKDKDRINMGNVKKNVHFIKKFLDDLKVQVHFLQGRSGSWSIQKESIKRSTQFKGDVLVIAGSTYVSLVDMLIGLPEKRIIKHSDQLPVMLINPRKDLYVMCD